MRSLAVLVMALIGGFAGGIVLNAVIALTSHMVFGGDEDGLKGLRYLPFVTSAWYAATLMIWRPRQEFEQ